MVRNSLFSENMAELGSPLSPGLDLPEHLFCHFPDRRVPTLGGLLQDLFDRAPISIRARVIRRYTSGSRSMDAARSGSIARVPAILPRASTAFSRT
jgi:hypothetical protein